METPRVFISYSWDNDGHKRWVRNLAETLVRNGINVRIDQWHVRPGDSFTHFMEKEVADSDFVLIICTPLYAAKSNARHGGVGYEQQIVSGHLTSGVPRSKFIPIIRTGNTEPGEDCALPVHFSGTSAIDFRDDNALPDRIEDLLRLFVSKPRYAPPPLGIIPSFDKSTPLQAVTDGTSCNLAESREFHNSEYCIFIFDLDDFTNINIAHGHEIGNQIINEILGILKLKLSQYDLKALDHGVLFIDEFFILFNEPVAKILGLIEDIRKFISEFDWNSIANNLFLTISGGYCDLNFKEQEPVEDLFIRALIGVKKSKLKVKNAISMGPIYKSNYKKLTVRHYCSGSLDGITGFDDSYVGNEAQVARGEWRVNFLQEMVYSNLVNYLTSVPYWTLANFVEVQSRARRYTLGFALTFEEQSDGLCFRGGTYHLFFYADYQWSKIFGTLDYNDSGAIKIKELTLTHKMNRNTRDGDYIRSVNILIESLKNSDSILIESDKMTFVRPAGSNLVLKHSSWSR